MFGSSNRTANCRGGEKRGTCCTYPMARPKCLMGNNTNSYRICKGHQTNVWWAMKVFAYTVIDLIHTSQNAPAPYPTMHHSEQKCAHFYSEWGIVGYGTGAFWDVWIKSIGDSPITTSLGLCCSLNYFSSCRYTDLFSSLGKTVRNYSQVVIARWSDVL